MLYFLLVCIFDQDQIFLNCCSCLVDPVWSTIGHCVKYIGEDFAIYPRLSRIFSHQDQSFLKVIFALTRQNVTCKFKIIESSKITINVPLILQVRDIIFLRAKHIVPDTASYIRGWIQMVLAPNDLFSWNNKYNK
jgi:hypothetical protein